MTSLFDELFREAAVTTLMEYHGDEDTVSYMVNGSSVTGIVALIGHAQTVEIEDSAGTIRKVFRRALVFTREAASQWGGISDPQFKGVFTIKGLDWRLEGRELAIEGTSESMVTVNVVRKLTVHKGQRNLRENS